MKNKILCITNDFGPRAGGIETFIIGLIERLPQNCVIVYTSAQVDSSEYDSQWLKRFGVEVIRDKSKILLPTPRVAHAVNTIVARRNIESVFFGASAPLGLLSFGLRRAGAKNIVALTHGHEVWWAKVWPFRIAMRLIGNGVDHLTYLGEFTRTAITQSLSDRAASAMIKIAPGIDIEHFSPRPDAHQLKTRLGLAEKKVIVSVGRLVHRKGQDTLISAMPQILEAVANAHLLLVGEGPYRRHLTDLATQLKVSDSVTFIGRIQYDELPRYICVGDIFAMPSRSRFRGLEVEGLGIVYLEASACGIAVVAGKSGGAPDAVVEGVTGVSVDGTSSKEVAQAVIDLLLNEGKAQSMGVAGRSWIEDNWRWEIWSEKFASVLSKDQLL